MRRDLPEGWAFCELGALVTPSKKRAEPGGTRGKPYIGLEHIEGGTNRIIGRGASSEVKSTTAMFSEGDVLFSKLRPYLNKVALAPFEGVGSTEILVFEKCSHLESKYLMWLLSRDAMVRIANDRAAGVQLPRITFEKIADIEVPVAPLPEQRRIVERVEALLVQVDRANARLDRVPMILKRFRQAVLVVACSGKLTEDWREEGGSLRHDDARELLRQVTGSIDVRLAEPLGKCPDSWAWAPLDILRRAGRSIIYGIIKPGPHVPNGVPYVRVLDMKNGTVDIANLRRADPARAAKFMRASLDPGDILISKDGTIGRVAVVPAQLVGGNITQHLIRFSAHPLLNRDYLVLALQCPLIQRWLSSETKGVALQGVNVADFRRLPIPIPPIAEQAEIVRRVSALMELANTIEREVARATVSATRVTQAILSRAFRGELVPTEAALAAAEGRFYETATEFLARIRGVRESAAIDGQSPRASSGQRRGRPLAASSASRRLPTS